jgi:putative transcriptional regulator
MENTTGNKIIEGLREFAEALENDDVISEKFTCRKVVVDLHPTEYGAAEVLATRKILRASQPVFAQFLGVSPKTVRGWEQGKVKPSDMACRFMDEIQRNPDYWRSRLKESVKLRTKDNCTC